MGKDLEQYADQRAQATFTENQEIARKLRAVTAELGEVTAERNRLAESLAAIQAVHDATLTLTPEPDWLKPRKRTKAQRVSLVAFLSDLHAGEVVRPEEMGGFNAYNLRIADLRLQRFFDEIIHQSRSLSGLEYDGLVLNLGGDLISGSIHDELRETDELSVLDSTLWVAPRLLAGIEKLAELFPLHIVSEPGNHGRDHKIPRYKGRSAHNADTHIARMVALYWEQRNPSANSVTFNIPETIDADFAVYGSRFSSEHGENYQRNNPGTAEIGSIGPVKRGSLRKGRAKAQEGNPFDYFLVAHYHQLVYAPSQGFVMNGSVKGYDEYARGLALKPEPPQQALFVVDPEHGPTIHTPLLVMDRKIERW